MAPFGSLRSERLKGETMKSFSFVIGLLAVNLACAQDVVRVPFSDASRPKTVRVHMLNGSISVTGYSGNEVVIETKGQGARDGSRRSDGMRRIEIGGGGLSAQRNGKMVTIKPSSLKRE